MSRLLDRRQQYVSLRRGVALLLPVLALIFALTLYPFAFSDSLPPQPALTLITGLSHVFDMLQNVLLFTPLGIALHWLLAGMGAGRRGQMVGALLVAGGLALAIEVAQLFIPGRTAALVDVLANAGGAALGSGRLAQPVAPVVDRMAGWCLAVVRQTPAALAGVGLIGWLLVAGGLLAYWQQATLPSNWSERYALQIGAASDGRRFWPGYAGFVALYDHAFTAAKARATLTPAAALAAQPLFAYDLTQFPPALDGPFAHSLAAQGKPAFTAEGVGVGYQRWLASSEPLAGVAAAVAQARAFTLVAQLAPREPERVAEGLMVNVGREIDSHNISLIQSGRDLLVRIRLPLTRPLNDRPALRFTEVFRDAKPRVVAFSYDGVTARLFVDGQPHRQTYTFGPGEVAVNRWLPVQAHQIGGWTVALAATLSAPLALVGAPWRGRRWWLFLLALAGPLIIGYAPWLVIPQPLSGAMALAAALTLLCGILLMVWFTRPFRSRSVA
ncbi:teicoplanin resistance protein VanZ [Chloroflexus islandicus]|uniref:Teicoplanin resistance protein VanZ n=1 Tax=Chloroflexus islandicus TaxID=1707952 RepID=A0A178LX28_9CHLR|nr:VanZ family protein [Chloroflexus islandicus]OAN38221.1 teicoplanin resistance protein VanZ [Chloroflexus islandicus]